MFTNLRILHLDICIYIKNYNQPFENIVVLPVQLRLLSVVTNNPRERICFYNQIPNIVKLVRIFCVVPLNSYESEYH